MRESAVEQRLARAVRSQGGLTAKHVSPGRAGDPDRLVVVPRPSCPTCGSRCVAGLMELKAPGERPRPLQAKRLQEWAALGLPADWADTPQRVDEVLKGWLIDQSRVAGR